MGEAAALRRAVRSILAPHLQALGFAQGTSASPTFVVFRRTTGKMVHLVEVQWEKYGLPRFIINFGMTSFEGMIMEGRRVPVEDLAVGWLPGNGRLAPYRGRTTSSWFRQDRPLLERILTGSALRPAEDVVAEAVSLFDEVEEYWRTGKLGPHVRLVR